MKIEAFELKNIPLIKQTDDIAGLICKNTSIQDKDIVVISSTIVSKSENRLLDLVSVKVTDRARRIGEKNEKDPRFVQAVLNESVEVLIESPFLLVVMKNGHICVNAGIDHSNVQGADNVLLLPEDADASAKRIKDSIYEKSGKKVSVVITDTNGRAFRMGQIAVAIGIAGIRPTRDWRGTTDLFGRVLEVKNEAIIDEIAGFANILLGEGSGGTPIALIRGLDLYAESYDIREIHRPYEEDVIRKMLEKTELL